MKCYNHQERDAIGNCKSCQKGLCSECHTTVDGSLSCKGQCEEDVAVLNYMIEQSRKVYKNLGSQWTPSILINCVGGAMFLGFGIYKFGNAFSWLLIGLGTVMLIGGIISFRTTRRMTSQVASNKRMQSDAAEPRR